MLQAIILGAIRLIGCLIGHRRASRAEDVAYDLDARAVYAGEYQMRGRRFAFDALVDGVNRLVRPLFTFGILYLFWWSADDPESFTKWAEAIAKAPDGMWAMLAIVVSFWFGGRLLVKDLRSGFTAKPRPDARRIKRDEDEDDIYAPNAVEREHSGRFWPKA